MDVMSAGGGGFVGANDGRVGLNDDDDDTLL